MSQKAIVLLVEAQADCAAALERALRAADDGFEPCDLQRVDVLGDALDMLATLPVDVLVLGHAFLQQPGGESTIATCHTQYPHIPIIALTPRADDPLLAQALADGASDYICTESLHARSVQHAVHVALQRARAAAQQPRRDIFADAMPHPIIEMTAQGKLVYVNPAADAMFPKLRAMPVQHPIVHGVFMVGDMLRGQGSKTITREIRIDERHYAQEISLVPHTDHLRMYVTDVTERKRLDRLKDEFLSTVSHELRTPLTIVKGALSNVVDGIVGPLTEKQEYVLRTADRNCDRLARIINDLLDLSRLESGKARLNRAEVDLASVVREVVESFALIASENSVTLRTDVPAQMPAVYADADMMMQVLTNLLDNAIRYCQGEVSVRLSIDGAGVCVSVTDDGKGMSPDDQKKLFNKFAQMHRIAGGAGYKGTGLGLSISREIIELHHGKIWVESALDTGTSFHFTIPVYNAETIFWEEYRAALAAASEDSAVVTVMWIGLENAAELTQTHSAVQVRSFLDTVEEALATGGIQRADRVLNHGIEGLLVVLRCDHDESLVIQQRAQELIKTCIQKLFTSDPHPAIAMGSVTGPADAGAAEDLLERAQQDAGRKGDVA